MPDAITRIPPDGTWRACAPTQRRLMVAIALSSAIASPGSAPAASPRTATLASGHLALRFTPGANGGIAMALASDAAGSSIEQIVANPVQVLVCTAATPGSTTCPLAGEDADQTPLSAPYAAVTAGADSSIIATSSVTSPAGSEFGIRDVYRAGSVPDTLTLSRTVTVLKAVPPDTGFNSAFTIGFADAAPVASTSFFAPGIWYNHNSWAPRTAFGKFGPDGSYNYAYWRETRSGLPLVAMQDPNTGFALTLAHVGATPRSNADEQDTAWLVDPSVQYGSLGVQKIPQTQIGFIYPADEGDGTGWPLTADTKVPASPTWVRRSHPVQAGFSHAYRLTLSLNLYAPNGNADYYAAMSGIWRTFYAILHPAVADVPVRQVFQDGISLLGAESQQWFGEPQGFPFQAPVSTGLPSSGDIGYQMGYTGQQIPGAYELLRDGYLHDDAALFDSATKQLNFWAQNADRSANAAGLPDTLYDFLPVKPSGWSNDSCNHPLFIRSLSDGMEGMLDAAVFLRRHDMRNPAWETFTQSFGDWLVHNQNTDGSFWREYNPDGSVFATTAACSGYGAGNNRLATTHPIRFLVSLYVATNNTSYLTSAEKAGEYARQAIYGPVNYVGGTSSYDRSYNLINDEPVLDREAGIEALHAALALYDATRQQEWLVAARQAADYTETWQYVQTYPLNGATPAVAHAGTRAFSLVETGASTADIGLSSESYDFFRLHLFGDDASGHYLAFARLLQNNSKLTTELGPDSRQAFGYAAPGLVGEADDVSYLSYHQSASAQNWLPWLSEAEVEPLQRMQDTFHALTIGDAERQPASQLQDENNNVHPAPGSIGWNRRP